MKCTNKLCWYHDTDYKDNCELIITDCKFLKMHNDEIRWIKRQKKLARIPKNTIPPKGFVICAILIPNATTAIANNI